MRNAEDITRTVEQHADTVLRVCAVYFGGKPERDDAFQETFIKYAQASTQFVDDEHKKAWLIRVAANVCKDLLKRAEAKTVLLDTVDDQAKPQWSQDPISEDRPESERLIAALQQLEETPRVILHLKYFEGYSAQEIGEMLDMPENTVYTHLARGRKKLKEVLTRG